MPCSSGGLWLESFHATANASGSATTEGAVWSPSVVVGTMNASVSIEPSAAIRRPKTSQVVPLSSHTCQTTIVVPPVFVAVPRGEGGKLKTDIQRSDPLVAPLGLNQRVGTLKVTTSGGAPVAEVPLVVQHEVPLAGIFGRAWDAIRLWIK